MEVASGPGWGGQRHYTSVRVRIHWSSEHGALGVVPKACTCSFSAALIGTRPGPLVPGAKNLIFGQSRDFLAGSSVHPASVRLPAPAPPQEENNVIKKVQFLKTAALVLSAKNI